MNPVDNPYRPPEADIEPPGQAAAAGVLLEEPRRVPAGNGMTWLGDGWELFKPAFGTWILMFIVSGAILMLASAIPLVGFFTTLVLPIFIGGWMLGCERMRIDGEVRLEDIFAGFSEHFGPLAIAALIYFAASIGAMIVAGLAMMALGGSAAVFLGEEPAGTAVGVGILFGVLVYLLLLVPALMLVWFAPPLIALHGVKAGEAVRLSLLGCWRNMLPLLVFGLVGGVLIVIGMLPLLLGLLIVYPILTCATYAAYREIYLADVD